MARGERGEGEWKGREGEKRGREGMKGREGERGWREERERGQQWKLCKSDTRMPTSGREIKKTKESERECVNERDSVCEKRWAQSVSV